MWFNSVKVLLQTYVLLTLHHYLFQDYQCVTAKSVTQRLPPAGIGAMPTWPRTAEAESVWHMVAKPNQLAIIATLPSMKPLRLRSQP